MMGRTPRPSQFPFVQPLRCRFSRRLNLRRAPTMTFAHDRTAEKLGELDRLLRDPTDSSEPLPDLSLPAAKPPRPRPRPRTAKTTK